MTNVLFF